MVLKGSTSRAIPPNQLINDGNLEGKHFVLFCFGKSIKLNKIYLISALNLPQAVEKPEIVHSEREKRSVCDALDDIAYFKGFCMQLFT